MATPREKLAESLEILRYLKAVDQIYVTDAYHSLSIEQYTVPVELIEKWLQVWGETANPDTYRATLVKQQERCLEKGANFIPVLYINGREFPKEYKREDLSFFIEDLAEHLDNLHSAGISSIKGFITEVCTFPQMKVEKYWTTIISFRERLTQTLSVIKCSRITLIFNIYWYEKIIRNKRK